jgi:hypothetical protein
MLRHRSHDRAGHTTSNYTFSSASSDPQRPADGAQYHWRTSPLPISTGALHNLDTPLHTLPISTGAPTIHTHLWTPPIPTTNHHRGAINTHSLLDTPLPLPISTGATQIHSLDTLTSTNLTNTLAMVALPLSTICLVCLGIRRAWWHPDKIP